MEIQKTAEEVHATNKEKGFWDNKRNVGELLMLITSELGEALEAHRKSRSADKEGFEKDPAPDRDDDFCKLTEDGKFKWRFEMYIKDTFEDEIADAIIRLLDLSAGLDIDIEWHIRQKMNYNKTRERLHGKAY